MGTHFIGSRGQYLLTQNSGSSHQTFELSQKLAVSYLVINYLVKRQHHVNVHSMSGLFSVNSYSLSYAQFTLLGFKNTICTQYQLNCNSIFGEWQCSDRLMTYTFIPQHILTMQCQCVLNKYSIHTQSQFKWQISDSLVTMFGQKTLYVNGDSLCSH